MLTEEFEVTVITGMLSLPGVVAGTSVVDGVKIVRVKSTSYPRSRLMLRGLNYLTYLLQSLRVGLKQTRPDVILCLTDPPMLADIGLILARRFRAPIVVASQDVFPEVAIELRRLDNRLLVWLLRRMVEFYLVRADRVIAIGDTMKLRLEEKGAPPAHMRVIPNWVEAAAITPQAKGNDWAREHELDGRFVVMHSGNVGHAQNLDALVRAATFLRDLDDLSIVIIGDGARRVELLDLATRLQVDSVQFLPYQPRDLLSSSLSAADVHVVGLARGLAGYVVPSRLYGVMAAGRPVIATADADSETALLVEGVDCGVVVEPGRPELLATMIRRAHDGELDLVEMGRRGRDYVVAEADRPIAVRRYRDVLLEVIR
jgi:glycosyltransferase involved in cell wall biosynthesis